MRAESDILCWDHGLSLDNPVRLYDFRSGPRLSEARPDMHGTVHLGVLLDGELESCYLDHRMRSIPGDVWFTAPWEPHWCGGAGSPTDIVLFTVLPERLGDIGVDAGVDWLLPFIVPVRERPRVADPGLREEVLRLAREARDIQESDGEFAPAAWLKLHELLLCLIRRTGFGPRALSGGRGMAFGRVMAAVSLARTAKRDGVTLEEAAKACHLGKSRFSALFKAATGLAFGQFAERARLGAAAEAVRRSPAPFKQIAADWGFYDESHFHRAFLRHFRRSPGVFRQESEQAMSPL